MTARDQTVERKPKTPNTLRMIAVFLELSMVATFIGYHAWIGLAFAFAYAWFSATWDALFHDDAERE